MVDTDTPSDTYGAGLPTCPAGGTRSLDEPQGRPYDLRKRPNRGQVQGLALCKNCLQNTPLGSTDRLTRSFGPACRTAGARRIVCTTAVDSVLRQTKRDQPGQRGEGLPSFLLGERHDASGRIVILAWDLWRCDGRVTRFIVASRGTADTAVGFATDCRCARDSDVGKPAQVVE